MIQSLKSLIAVDADHLPSTAALRAFEAAARHGSFTAAAAELNQTQGAISHQIRELEARLGRSLFLRQARGIALTDAGRTYLPFAGAALDRLRAGQEALRPQDQARVLTVSCSPNFAQKWLVPRLGAFAAAAPEIDLRISAAAQHVTFQGDGIDLAVRHGDGRWPELAVTRLCPERIFPVCSPQLKAQLEMEAGFAVLQKAILIHDQTRGAWARWLTAVGADPKAFDLARGPLLSQTSFAIDAAVAGQGIALARSALADLDLKAGRLLRPLAAEQPADFAYWIVCPKPKASQAKIKLFRDWLLAEAESDCA